MAKFSRVLSSKRSKATSRSKRNPVTKLNKRPVITTAGTQTVVKRDKFGNIKKIKTDYTKNALKRGQGLNKVQLSKDYIELEKTKSNNLAKIAIAGEAGATVTSSVGTGVGLSSVNQQVNGGMTTQGGLGRDEAENNNNPPIPHEGGSSPS